MLSPLLDAIFGVLSVLFALIVPPMTFIVCDYNRRNAVKSQPNANSAAAGQLRPVEIATLQNDGVFRAGFLWPELVRLAIAKILTIERTGKRITWAYGGRFRPLKYKTISVYNLTTSITQAQFDKLDPMDKKIMAELFASGREFDLFAGRDYLAARLPYIGQAVRESLVRRGLLSEETMAIRQWFLVVGTAMLAIGLLFVSLDIFWRLSAAVSGMIAVGFGIVTPKATPEGIKIISEFKKSAKSFATLKKDKKPSASHITNFEKILPVALALGLDDALMQRAATSYGINFLTSYRPDWHKDFEEQPVFDAKNLVRELDEAFTFSSYRPAISLEAEA